MTNFKVGSIVTWHKDGEKTVGTVTDIRLKRYTQGIMEGCCTEIKVDWNILNPNNYSHCNVSHGDLALFEFQIGDIFKVKPHSTWQELPLIQIKVNTGIYNQPRLLGVFEYLDATHEFLLDGLRKVENNMDETIKRLEADLKKALQEVEELKKELKPKASFSQNGLYVAKWKYNGNLVLASRLSHNNSSVYVAHGDGEITVFKDAETFLESYVVQRNVRGAVITRIIEDLMKKS